MVRLNDAVSSFLLGICFGGSWPGLCCSFLLYDVQLNESFHEQLELTVHLY